MSKSLTGIQPAIDAISRPERLILQTNLNDFNDYDSSDMIRQGALKAADVIDWRIKYEPKLYAKLFRSVSGRLCSPLILTHRYRRLQNR
jgi:hypothetical protein